MNFDLWGITKEKIMTQPYEALSFFAKTDPFSFIKVTEPEFYSDDLLKLCINEIIAKTKSLSGGTRIRMSPTLLLKLLPHLGWKVITYIQTWTGYGRIDCREYEILNPLSFLSKDIRPSENLKECAIWFSLYIPEYICRNSFIYPSNMKRFQSFANPENVKRFQSYSISQYSKETAIEFIKIFAETYPTRALLELGKEFLPQNIFNGIIEKYPAMTIRYIAQDMTESQIIAAGDKSPRNAVTYAWNFLPLSKQEEYAKLFPGIVLQQCRASIPYSILQMLAERKPEVVLIYCGGNLPQEILEKCAVQKSVEALKYAGTKLPVETLGQCALKSPIFALENIGSNLPPRILEICALRYPNIALRYVGKKLSEELFNKCARRSPQTALNLFGKDLPEHILKYCVSKCPGIATKLIKRT